MGESAIAIACPDEPFALLPDDMGQPWGSKMQLITVKAWLDIWPWCIHWLKIILFITSTLLAVPYWEQRVALQG